MDLSMVLKVGDKLEIEPIRSGESTISKPIVSQLIDIKDDLLFISSPIKQGMKYPLHVGQKITILFFRDEKGVYSFKGEVIQRIDIQLPIYTIQPISSPEKTQRRFYFRLKALTKVLIKGIGETEAVETYTKDISGGGMKVVSKKLFNEGQKVECAITLEESKTVTVVGEVIRAVRSSVTNEYELAIGYIDIADNTRNEIISFIFKKQRELLQKGLI
ncbi:flagellar brake protein [Clostridium formicaceticum]|uniref:Flagellar brake protein YcgR n=1 Tax=Clostridium formicaceticum TaxID=1497 RepID=A0AAC9WGH9_9CLOT|nr:flagellar brake protein [Clostridium formicaceticum]AOY77298.1 hypothetical protein BJL90_16455 [Clostridium formicaceticum]ARE87841.1 Flagellar brake protein YcgR [Clostridium formicaceticum]